MEPYQDPELVRHTKNVDAFLHSASSTWTGVAQGAADTPLQQLQQRFEADMTSSVWQAFQRLPDCSGQQTVGVQSTFFIPGYGDCRRRPVRRRRSQRSFRKSHLDMYLGHSLQEARLGDLWSTTSTYAWNDPDLEPVSLLHSPRTATYEKPAVPPTTASATAAVTCTPANSFQPCLPATSSSMDSCSTTSPPSAKPAADHTLAGACAQAAEPAGNTCGNEDGKLAPQVPRQLNISQLLLHTFLGCLVLLPLLWAAQQVLAGGHQEHSALMDRLRLWACSLFIPLFLYLVAQCMAESWAACTAQLHFPDAATEARFTAWFATWTWPPDAALCALWTAASIYAWSCGPLAAARAPAPAPLAAPAPPPASPPAPSRWLAVAGLLLPLLLRVAAAVPCGRRHWRRRHELVVVLAKLGYTAIDACVLGFPSQPPALPEQHAGWQRWLAYAPPLAALLLQARTSAFLPTQLLHVAVVLLGPRGKRSVLHAVQVVALDLCVPTLWLYARERHARKRFVGLGLSKSAALLDGPGAAMLYAGPGGGP